MFVHHLTADAVNSSLFWTDYLQNQTPAQRRQHDAVSDLRQDLRAGGQEQRRWVLFCAPVHRVNAGNDP